MCPICQASTVSVELTHQGYDICRCGACRHLWARGAAQDYAEGTSQLEHYKSVEATHRMLMRKCLRAVQPYFDPKSRILDFGCGPGLFVLEARREGYDAVGLDLAEWVRAAAAHWSVPLEVSRLEDRPFAPESFDAVVSIVSFEHLDDPSDVTKRLVELLRPGGIFAVVSVPNGDGISWRLLRERWWDLNPPSHIHFFTPRSMRALLEQNGLRVVRLSTSGVGTDFFARLRGRPRDEKTLIDSFQEQVNTGETVNANGGFALVRRLATHVAIPALNWCLDVTRLGNNLTAIARKGRDG